MSQNWKFILSDVQGNNTQPVVYGELTNAMERQVIRSLSAPSTAGFRIGADHPLLSTIFTHDCNLKVYRDNALLFHGPIITSELATDDTTQTPTVTCAAADPAWRFDKKIVGQSGTGTLYNGTDRLTIINTELNAINSNYSGLNNTGVQSLGGTCGSTAVYTVGPYKKFSEVIADMANTLSGFDWYIAPTEPVNTLGFPMIGNFFAAASIGSQKPGAVFEYQGRGNARTPHYIRDLSTSANNVFSIPDDGPTSALGVRQKFDASFGPWVARGTLDEIVDTSGITNATLRDAVLQDHLTYRQNPRQVVTFQPDIDDNSGRVPQWGVDYGLGDFVRARINYNGATLVDGYVRIYKMQFDVDDNNRETLTPTVVSEA